MLSENCLRNSGIKCARSIQSWDLGNLGSQKLSPNQCLDHSCLARDSAALRNSTGSMCGSFTKYFAWVNPEICSIFGKTCSLSSASSMTSSSLSASPGNRPRTTHNSLLLAIRWPHAACPSLGVGCPRLMYWQPLHCILLSFVCFSSFPIHFHTHSNRSQPPIQQGLIEPMGTPLFLLHLFYDCRAHSLSPHTPLSKGHVLHVLLYLTALHQADSALRTRQIRTWPCRSCWRPRWRLETSNAGAGFPLPSRCEALLLLELSLWPSGHSSCRLDARVRFRNPAVAPLGPIAGALCWGNTIFCWPEQRLREV